MTGMWIVHVKTCLQNGIIDVRPRDGEVLKRVGKAPVLGWIV
jgi:hypothetical protein